MSFEIFDINGGSWSIFAILDALTAKLRVQIDGNW